MSASQQQLQEIILPKIKESGAIYHKFQPVHARQAAAGEKIITEIDGKKETENTANEGDYIVKNRTSSAESYIVPRDKFMRLYKFSMALDGQWDEYLPQGKIRALELDPHVCEQLGLKPDPECSIIAPWGEEQFLELGDFLVSPLPALNEVYGIARSVFDETYKPV